MRGGPGSCLPKGAPLSSQACVRTFHETPLQLLEKIKNFFNETKNLLEKDWKIFSKNCNNSFAKCSSRGKHRRASYREGRCRVRHGARGIPEAAWVLSVFLCFVYSCGFMYLGTCLCGHVCACTLTYACMYCLTATLHVPASRRPLLVAVTVVSGEGELSHKTM